MTVLVNCLFVNFRTTPYEKQAPLFSQNVLFSYFLFELLGGLTPISLINPPEQGGLAAPRGVGFNPHSVRRYYA
jgi:hypothetical protein